MSFQFKGKNQESKKKRSKDQKKCSYKTILSKNMNHKDQKERKWRRVLWSLKNRFKRYNLFYIDISSVAGHVLATLLGRQ
ncbi:hypothetical protein BpHYR1_002150 [Brachionus plicatilis]|uniref:Uncharacterized protein n=1 Tax=Brachionus plicatilis TaxID=10195 RepID=A0A3M7PJF4_BRAPC|nr:hypothetical protein BpHYR1_002150 [Brachionus plicatilis]